MAITASMVKELRGATGAGMMEHHSPDGDLNPITRRTGPAAAKQRGSGAAVDGSALQTLKRTL